MKNLFNSTPIFTYGINFSNDFGYYPTIGTKKSGRKQFNKSKRRKAGKTAKQSRKINRP